MKMSSQVIMSGKEANNDIGLCPVEGHYSGLCSQTGARNKFSNLPTAGLS